MNRTPAHQHTIFSASLQRQRHYMLKSMTGFGGVAKEKDGIIIRVEIKSLNSKHLDLSVRVPRAFSEKEITLRTQLASRLSRGKVNLNIDVEYQDPKFVKRTLNRPLLHAYLQEVKEVAQDAGIEPGNALPALLGLSDILQAPTAEPDGANWELVEEALKEALDHFDAFREREGQLLETELREYVQNIQAAFHRIQEKKDERMEKYRENLRTKLREFIDEGKLDSSRFEQEMVFYSEKLDITEELVRLQSHIDLFLQTLEEDCPGKKIGFIVQEMGREINTTGSKANDAEIQKEVVLMKEELEKIKEQSFNIL